jgi:hypothetical protein
VPQRHRTRAIGAGRPHHDRSAITKLEHFDLRSRDSHRAQLLGKGAGLLRDDVARVLGRLALDEHEQALLLGQLDMGFVPEV